MAPTITRSPSPYGAPLSAHRFRQGTRDVYYFTLDLATLDGLLPQRVDDTVVREANRRLTPRHAQDIQQYLESRADWLLGPMLLGIAPDALAFEPYQDEAGEEISANFGELKIRTNRANTMRIFDGQHRRRAIQETLDRLGSDPNGAEKLASLQEASVPIVLYAEEDLKELRQMFTDASRTKRIEANVVTRFDKQDPFNLAAMHLVDASQLFRGRVEMDATTVAHGNPSLLSVNQLAQILKMLTVGGYGRRVSRGQSEALMHDIDGLYEQCLAWSDGFMPAVRWEYGYLLTGELTNENIPALRVESLAYSATFMRILAGCYHDWMAEETDWKPLAAFLEATSLDVGGGEGTLLVDAGAMLPGGTSPMARRQEVESAIRYIVRQAKASA